MIARLVRSAMLFPFLFGCTTIHLERNAPGIVEVDKPPKRIEREALVLPDDPGENYLVFSGGPFIGVGWRIPEGDAKTTEQTSGGLELAIEYGQNEKSHMKDSFIKLWPRWSIGVNFGWVLLERRETGVGPGYIEAQGRYSFFGLGAGYSWVQEKEYQGPHFTLFAGPIYVRVSYLSNTGTDLLFGLVFKTPLSLTWSR